VKLFVAILKEMGSFVFASTCPLLRLKTSPFCATSDPVTSFTAAFIFSNSALSIGTWVPSGLTAVSGELGPFPQSWSLVFPSLRSMFAPPLDAVTLKFP